MEEITVVVVPFPMHAHVIQLLHLSLHLSSRGLPVHFASSAAQNLQARRRLHGWDPTSLGDIRFHDLPLSGPSRAPPPPGPNPDHNFPSHLIPAFYASSGLRPPLASLLRSLSSACRRLVVIHDLLMTFAGQAAAEIPNAEIYHFEYSAINELPFHWDPSSFAPDPKPKPEALGVILSQFEGSMPEELWGFFSQLDFQPREAGTLYNVSRPIEGEFFDLLAMAPRYRGKKHYAIGPLNPTAVPRSAHPCLQWLDKQPDHSVVYVSFGSSVTLRDEQIKQLAIGLTDSGQRFVWALRDADKGDVSTEDEDSGGPHRGLPPGFEREIEGAGMIVGGWAPQLDILAHRATGAFMSHCGWNSCIESLSMGVPIIAWPMHTDQPRNALMVTNYLKAGILGRDWGRRKEVIPGSEIGAVIKRMMTHEEGKQARKRAESIGEEVRIAVSDSGSSRADLDSFIDHIRR